MATKANELGVSSLVPMKLWPAQRAYIEGRTHRDIVLKGRQMGLSTGIMAANSHRCFTIPYTKMTIVTHKEDVSQFLLQTVSRFWRNLPDEMRPESDWHSGRRIRLPKLDSYIHIDTAESDAIGFGETLNIAHLSEMSRWPGSKAKDLFNGITQTVPLGGFITVESTPKGRTGLFYDLYTATKKGDTDYKLFFFPWWFDPNYKSPVENKFEPNKEERQLMEAFKLVPEQIIWRRKKISEIGDDFYQEYPENDVDCWLSNELSAFDGIAIRQYLQQIQGGREEGYVTVWKGVLGGERYVMGVDTAGGNPKGDWSVASVLNVRRNEYVARLRARIPPDLFAREVARLGHRYNDAEVAVERESFGHVVLRVLLENNYPNLYYFTDYDTFTGMADKQPGWRTNLKTKPEMISRLQSAIRARDIVLWSENLLLEASGYIIESGKFKTSAGGHDDELDALMIALQLREQAPITEATRYKVQSYARI